MKAGKFIKRFFLFFFVLLLLLVGAAIAIPYFFKDELLQRVKADINKAVDAKVDFSDVHLSLLRSFPDFNFQLDDFSLTGINEFEGIPLASVKQLDFSLDIKSVINKESAVEIHSIHLEKPSIQLITLKNGQANYQIAKGGSEESAELQEPYNFLVQLEEYGISDGHFIYDDRLGNLYIELEGLNHNGSGDFTQDVFDLVTTTNIAAMTTRFDGIRYLKKAKGDFDITFNADVKNNQYTLKDNEIRLNDFLLKADGHFTVGWDEIDMDLQFNAPQNSFKSLLSLIPSAYTSNFKDVQADGSFLFNGFAKGAYSLSEAAYPAFQLNLKVDKADFKYPDLPIGIKDIATAAKLSFPGGRSFDKMVVDVRGFKMLLGENPFRADLLLKTPVSDPNIKTTINGTIDLADLSRAMPMEGVKELNGRIVADVDANTRMSFIDKKEYEKVDMRGQMIVSDLKYTVEDIPPVNIRKMDLNFTPQNVKVNEFDAKLGSSDINASGTVDNILAYFSPEKTMTGQLTVHSSYFNTNEWIPEPDPNAVIDTTSAAVEIFDRFNFDVNGKIGKLDYTIYTLEQTSVVGSMGAQTVVIKDFRTKIGHSDIAGKGKLTNFFSYIFENGTLGGQLAINSNFLDANQFMVAVDADGQPKATPTSGEQELQPFLVPDKVDVSVDANIGSLQYTNIELKNVTGRLHVKDQIMRITKAKANTMGGQVNIAGGYDTRQPDKPKFDLTFDVASMQFQEAFEKLNSFQLLAPIGRFIKGQFNTSMSFNGDLTKDLMPDLNSLTADGMLHTINAVVTNFKPLQEVGNMLNVSAFKNLELKNTKNWFDIKDGRVILKDFKHSFNGIDMTVGGSHGINTEMDYQMLAKIPRKLLEKNSVGQSVNRGLDLLTKEASKIGLNINNAEFINVKMNIGGSIKNPKISIKPVGTDGQSIKDELVNTAKDLKDQAVNQAKGRLEQEKEKVQEQVDVAKQKAKDKGREALDTILTDPGNAKDKLKDVFSGSGKDILNRDSLNKQGKDVKKDVKEGVNKLKKLFGKKKKN